MDLNRWTRELRSLETDKIHETIVKRMHKLNKVQDSSWSKSLDLESDE